MPEKNKEDKIDFVILWVDGNDPEWQKEKSKYDNNVQEEASSKIRFRDWKTLKYWFRGVERYTPWVNKVYLITNGQKPEWINESCEKLKIVNHKDFMPSDALPTFNSNAIEIGLNSIKELSENFVCFNDDMFIVNHMNEEDFFQDGLPCDSFVFNAVSIKKSGNMVEHIILNDLEILSKYFDKKSIVKENRKKIYNFKYGKKLMKSFLLSPWKYFTGIENPHIPLSIKKSTMNKLWEIERDELIKTQYQRFRSKEDYSIWIYRYWQLFSGEFIPSKTNKNRFYDLQNNNQEFFNEINNGKYNMVCINDSDDSIDFDKVSAELIEMFEKRLPEKSSFEL